MCIILQEGFADDPGILIYFADPLTVHNCLGLPSVASITGAWGAPNPMRLVAPAQGKDNLI